MNVVKVMAHGISLSLQGFFINVMFAKSLKRQQKNPYGQEHRVNAVIEIVK